MGAIGFYSTWALQPRHDQQQEGCVGMRRTIASDTPLAVGQLIEVMGRWHRIVAEIPRNEWWAEVQRQRQLDRQAGELPARAGFYIPGSKRFVPDRTDPPEEFCHCYLLEEW